MAIVGAYVRFGGEDSAALRDRLARIEGVEPFDLDPPGTLGLIIEAENVDAAHARLTGQVRAVEGVLGVWPIYVNIEDEHPIGP